jgi:hypothetical protein
MTYDYDNAPTDPHRGGKMTAEMAAARIAELEAALRWYVKHVEDCEGTDFLSMPLPEDEVMCAFVSQFREVNK